MKIVPLSAEHFAEHSAQIPGCYCCDDYAKVLCEGGVGFAVINYAGVTVAMAGVLKLWPGVGEAWTFITDHARQPFFLHRQVLRYTELIAKNCQMHRVHAHTDLGDARSERWMTKLGFTNEGVMVRYTFDKKSVTRWAKIW